MGGLIDLSETDFCVYGADKKLIETQMNSMEPPHLPRWFAFIAMAIQRRGGQVGAARDLHRWVSENPAFEEVVAREFFLPIYPFFRPQDHHWRAKNRIGEYMREAVIVSSVSIYEACFTDTRARLF